MEIPEILEKVASYLDSKSLVSASTVSRHWHAHLSPLIWHTISPHDWTRPAFRPRSLYAQAHLVRDFGWHAMTSSVYQQAVAARALQLMAGAGGEMGTIEMGASSRVVVPPSEMTQVDVREGGDIFAKQLPLHPDQEQHHLLQQEGKGVAAADFKTRNGQVPTTTASSHTTTTIATTTPKSPPVPVLDQLSLICLTNIVGQCVNLQKLCLHALNSPSDFISGGRGGIHLDMILVLQSLVYLQSLELYVNRVVVYQDMKQDGGHGGGGGGGLVRTVDRGIVVQDLIRPLTQLSELSLRGTAFIFDTPSTRTDPDSESTPSPTSNSTATTDNKDKGKCKDKDTFPSIQHLILDTPFITLQELIHLLTETPSLQSLDLPGGLFFWALSPPPPTSSSNHNHPSPSSDSGSSLVETLRTHNTHLCEFSINSSAHPSIPESHLVHLITHGFTHPIRRFGARSCQLEEGEIFTALLNQQATAFALLSEEQGVNLNLNLDLDLDNGEWKGRYKGLEELDISLAKKVGPLFRERFYGFLSRVRGLKRLEADGVWISLEDLLVPGTEEHHHHHHQQQQQQQQQQQEQEQGAEGEDMEGDGQAVGAVGAVAGAEVGGGGGGGAIGLQDPLSLTQAQAQAQTQNIPTHPQQQQSYRPPCPGFASNKTLTHLHIGFSHPARTASPEHLQKMYTLLSTLAHLTYLQLSYTCISLPFSTEFKQLAALKSLREFNIETCGYPSLSREDLEYMVVQNWPRLEKLVLNQLGASQERVMKGWLREFGREDLVLESARPSGAMFF
jgi:hypothetical protein